MIPIAAPLLPLAEQGLAAAAATIAVGSFLHVGDVVSPFRGGARALPPVTGREGEATLAEMMEDAIAGARLQVGFVQPPPQGPDPRDLLIGIGAAGLGAWHLLQQYGAALSRSLMAVSPWGWMNRPRIPDTVGTWPGAPQGTRVSLTTSPRAVSYNITASYHITQWVGNGWADIGTLSRNYWEFGDIGTPMTGASLNLNLQAIEYWGAGNGQQAMPRLTGTATDGRTVYVQLHQRIVVPGTISISITPAETNQAGWATQTNVTSPPASRVEQLPAITPAKPATFPPIGAPSLPSRQAEPTEAEPLPQTETDPAVAPVSVPTLPRPVTFPAAQPAQTQGFTPAGLLQGLPQPAPRQTPTGSHFVAGREIPAPSARADIASIATELQRVEAKTAAMMEDAAKAVDPSVSIGDILQALRSLVEAIMDQQEPGEYAISSPCVVDEFGDRIEKVAEYGGASTIKQIHNKIDALAELLQHHKDLLQPNCEDPPPPHSNITVQFTEVI